MQSTTFQPGRSPGYSNLRPPVTSGTAYDQPDQVLRDDALSTADKRTILSSWASDANAVEHQPWLRLAPGHSRPVALRAILDALRSLDDDEPPPKGGASIRLNSVALPRGNEDDDRPAWRRHHGLAQHAARVRSIAVPRLRRQNAVGASRAAAGGTRG